MTWGSLRISLLLVGAALTLATDGSRAVAEGLFSFEERPMRPPRDIPAGPRSSSRPTPAAHRGPSLSFLERTFGMTFSSTRQIVADPTGQRPGTIVIETQDKALYLVLEDGRALRYAIGVGREGFTWRGTTTIGDKAEWPDWRPPAQMLQRRPDLPRYMPGGPKNPLGARALYLHAGGRDTLFRIHGTNEAWSIGRNVSSGCIRLLNDDVVHLYERAPVGTRVIVH
jgi:lipoprotein-anchoring transpeptidase ErfK/SrfK